MSLFIGIDSGTQSTKAVALDTTTGEVIAQTRATYGLIPGLPSGHMEQHPGDWVEALNAVISEVVAKVDASKIRGIGVSGQQHGFVPLDARGEVIRPAKLWCDTSTVAECAILMRRLGGATGAIRHTGNIILPGYTAPKILWLKRNEPQSYKRLRHVLLPHDFLNFYLTGRMTAEFGDGSGTALMDVKKRAWSQAAIKAVDSKLAAWLPPLRGADTLAGPVRDDIARKLGLPSGVIVSSGGGDNMMGAIGTGNIRPGVVTASFGTSGTIYAFSKKPVIDPQGEIAAFCSSTGGWLPLLCTMNVTSVTEKVRDLFALSHDAVDSLMAKIPVGSDGLTMLPYFAGERTPNLPLASGVLYGINSANCTQGHITRAAVEGVVMGMNYGLRRLVSLGIKPTEIRLTGGGSRSKAWRQMAADIFGVPVVCMKEDEGAALGGALQAAWSIGRQADRRLTLEALVDRCVELDRTTRVLPQAGSVRVYRRLQAFHDELSIDLRPSFARGRN